MRGHQSAVRDQDRPGRMPAPDRGQREQGRDGVNDTVSRRLRHPEEGAELPHRQVRTPVRGHHQHPVLQRQSPSPATGRRPATAAPHHPDQLAELPLAY